MMSTWNSWSAASASSTADRLRAGAPTQHGGGSSCTGRRGSASRSCSRHSATRARAHGFHQLTVSGVQSEARLAFAGLHQLCDPC